MKIKKICITDVDKQRLMNLITSNLPGNGNHHKYFWQLYEELEKSEIVSQNKIPANVITMNSEFVIKDLATEEKMTYQLVYPEKADINKGKMSVLSPVGAILLGYRSGDIVECKVPAGALKIKIIKILFQPEASGNYHL